MTALLYLLMIFVWGFSWIAITSQQGDVPTEVSILYRFSIAASLMSIIGVIFKNLQPTSARHHLFFALQGVCLFCVNFLAFYQSTHYIASGLTAVVMATAPIFNAIHGKWIYGIETKGNFWLGVSVGLAGICLLFGHDLLGANWSIEVLYGLMYALMGTWCFSMGNMISIQNSRNQIQAYTATSYAMVYGCIALLGIIMFKGISFDIDMRLEYLTGLAYLAVPASVIGFTVYLNLVDRLGANQAAYLMLITPIVALAVSSLFEDYHWSVYSTLGLSLVISGNLLAQMKPETLAQAYNKLKTVINKQESGLKSR